ncbi:MAG: sugar transferase [Gammaproteobacteria bacterium]
MALSPAYGAPRPAVRRQPQVEPGPRAQALIKRGVDVAGAVALGVVFSPLIAFVICALKLDGGPVLFAHSRVGRNGRRFRVYKFRSMVADAQTALEELLDQHPELREEWERDHKLRNDPRVTRLGRFLRKTSLDELPQLLNVLKGEMSLVGPRPIVDAELRRYGRAVRYYLASKPGITGLWQVSGRSDTDYGRRVAMDRYYAENGSVLLDLSILARTVLVVLGRRGAY